MENFIETKNLSFRYSDQDKDLILDNISLGIKQGEFVCILGRNGSGKSTLVKTFNSLLLPSEGKVYVNGMDTADEKHNFEIHKQVGLILQNPDNQIVSSIVEEDVAFGPENLGLAPAEIKYRVERALNIVGLESFSQNITHKLSGGQKQKLAIAEVLAMEPQCIILDEPTSMLDSFSQVEILKILKKINKKYKITVILVTHSTREAMFADRAIVMEKGRIAVDTKPVDVFSDIDLLNKFNLHIPQGIKLLLEFNKKGVSLHLSDLSVDGCVASIEKFLEDKNAVN
ncbi:MAG: energy-coupling factor transporter ATPase [Clostridia bacterium]|nr:energy-coupling factor transporter ATPase [Clostridia bacterium]